MMRRMNFGLVTFGLLITAFGAFSAGPASGSAMAAPRAGGATDPLTHTGHICLKNAPSLCIKSNGTSQQVTITSNASDYATFIAFNGKNQGGVHTFQLRNGLGNCLRAGVVGADDIGPVKIEDGSCDPNDGQDTWYAEGSNLLSFQIQTLYMATKGDVSGYKVWTNPNPFGNGWWPSWTFPTD